MREHLPARADFLQTARSLYLLSVLLILFETHGSECTLIPFLLTFHFMLFDFSLSNCLVSQFEVDVIQDLRLPREYPPGADVESPALEKDMSVPPALDQEGLLGLSHFYP